MTDPETAMTWEPILEDELAHRAWVCVRAIADDLATASHPPGDLALCWSYLAPALGDARSAERHDAAMAGLAQAIQHGSLSLGLHEGMTSVGWTAAHTADGVDDFLVEVDAELIRRLRGVRWTGSYDLISGLVGFGVYFLERDHAEGVGLVVDQLVANARHGDAGAYWHTPAEQLPPKQRAGCPDGYINCGLAHGVPGVIALLARIAARPGVSETVAELRDAAAHWMTAQRGTSGRFPSWIADEHDRDRPARTAWCYGDPGVLLALWSAAHGAACSTVAIEDHALECLGRDYADTGVVDAMLCHGTIGLAHISNRFYQATHDPRFRDHARTWYERTLALQVPGTGVGGFTAVRYDRDPPNVAVVDLVDGSIGIALGLLAGLVPLEPAWDRLLLADLTA